MKFRPLAAACSAFVWGAALANAQTPPAAPATYAASVAPAILSNGPDSLPGDYVDLPQKDQLHVPLGPPAGTQAGAPPPTDPTPSPGLELALEAAKAAVASCAADGYRVSVAVTDAAGKLKAALAADGVAPNRVYMAIRKDVTVVAFRTSTLALRDKLAANPSLMRQVKPNMSLLPGGMPIVKADRLLGAIATSGATAHEEEKCAQAGVEKIRSRLK